MAKSCSFRPKTPLPFLSDVWIGLITVGSIYFCNQSLRINTVTLYQIGKLLNIPTLCLFQYLLNGKKHSIHIYLSLVGVTIGVGISTIAEFNISASVIGLVMAALGVVVTVIDQMEVGRLKQKYEASAVDFLHSNIPHRIVVGACIVAAFEIEAVTKAADVPFACWMALLVSCIFATAINLTQVVIISNFGPLALAVTGHVKTMTIMTLGFFWTPPAVDYLLAKKVFGIVFAMAAAIKYGQLTAFPTSSVTDMCCSRRKSDDDEGDVELSKIADSPKPNHRRDS